PAPAVVPPSYLGPSAASGNRIWAAGHPYIYASYDRGHSWRKDSSGFSTTHVRGLAFRDTANGLACDDRNTLRRTTDGGRTWQPLPHQGDVYNRLQVIPGTSTYLSYNSLTLPTGPATNTTYSTDDGLTWHYFILPRTPDFLFFTTPSEGYFVELPNQFHAWSGGPFPQAVTGLPAEEASTEVRLWPNPTTGLSQLSSEHPLQHVRVLNTLGQSVWEAPASGQLTIEVNARHLSPGLYLLQTTDAAGIRRQLRLVRE
ncbi:MAG TPA: T9SS type A sorting domain-containing protein, partial [bacterium]|nr:T9SS type A sorting domain-containing protein [bacterium]